MALGSIYKETGRATYDELRRIRLSIEELQQFQNSLVQALIRSGTDEGPVGVIGNYLRLDATNDPVTGDLSLTQDLQVSGNVGIGTAPTIPLVISKVGADPVAKFINAGSVSAINPATLGNIVFWHKVDEEVRTDGTIVTSFDMDALSSHPDLEWTLRDGEFTYRASTGPNSNPWIEATDTSNAFENATETGLSGAFVGFAVYRTPGADGQYGQPFFGNKGGSKKESLRFPSTRLNEDQIDVFIANSPTVLANDVADDEGNDLSEETWYLVCWQRQTNGLWRGWWASQSKALAEYTSTSLTNTATIQLDGLYIDRTTAGQERGIVGQGWAEFVLFDTHLTDAQIQGVYNYLAERHNFPTIGSPAGDLLQLANDSGIQSVFDENGWLHIGGSDPDCALEVEGSACINGNLDVTGNLTAASLNVSGHTSLSTLHVSSTATFQTHLYLDGDDIRLYFGELAEASIRHDAFDNLVIQPEASGVVWFDGDALFPDTTGKKLFFGNSKDAEFFYDGTDMVVDPDAVGSGILDVRGRLKAEKLEVTGLTTLSASVAFSLAVAELLLGDNEKIILGDGLDSEIYYDGSDLILNPDAVGSGAVSVRGQLEVHENSSGAGDAQVRIGNGPETRFLEILRNTGGSNAQLNNYHNGTSALIDLNGSCTTGSGSTVTYRFGRRPAQDASDHDYQQVQFLNGPTTYHSIRTDNQDTEFYGNGTGIVLFHTGLAVAGDNVKALFGAGDDASIYYDGTDLIINPQEIGSGQVEIMGDLQAGAAVFTSLHVTEGVSTISGSLVFESSSSSIRLYDNVLIVLGDTADSTIQFDGTNLAINAATFGSGILDVQTGAQFNGQVSISNGAINLASFSAATPSGVEVNLYNSNGTLHYKNSVSDFELPATPSVTTASHFMGTVLQTIAPSSTTFTVSLSTGFDYITIEGFIDSNRASTLEDILVAVNGDTTTTNYNYCYHSFGQGGHASGTRDGTDRFSWWIPGATSPANGSCKVYAKIEQYENTSYYTSLRFDSTFNRLSPDGMKTIQRDYEWQSTASATYIRFTAANASTLSGSLKVIGWKSQTVVTSVT